MAHDNCVFCAIVSKQLPAHVVWESETHLAFLSIFPNTKGFTVVIPKKHQGSYAFEQDDQVLKDLIIATKQTAKVLDNYFDDVARCGMFFEGYGVDHLHSKLFPMHGTKQEEWKEIERNDDNRYYEKYPGFLSSNNSHPADQKELAELAKAIRESQTTR